MNQHMDLAQRGYHPRDFNEDGYWMRCPSWDHERCVCGTPEAIEYARRYT